MFSKKHSRGVYFAMLNGGGYMFGFGRKKQKLQESRVAVLVADGVEQVLLDEPVRALRKKDVQIFLVSPQGGSVQAMKGNRRSITIQVDAGINEVHPASFVALLVPGGPAAIEELRQNKQVLQFVRTFTRYGKPIAAAGYAPLLLAAAGLVDGRTVTSWPGIQDELIRFGAIWVDEPYVLDDVLLTGRDPRAFSKQIAKVVDELAMVV
jgi:protease I